MNTELLNALCNGVAVFSYIKVNKDLRTAVGTLNPFEIAKVAPHVTVGEIAKAIETNRYYDLQFNGWRRIAYDVRLSQDTLVGSLDNENRLTLADVA